jgi:hypothetical protein
MNRETDVIALGMIEKSAHALTCPCVLPYAGASTCVSIPPRNMPMSRLAHVFYWTWLAVSRFSWLSSKTRPCPDLPMCFHYESGSHHRPGDGIWFNRRVGTLPTSQRKNTPMPDLPMCFALCPSDGAPMRNMPMG